MANYNKPHIDISGRRIKVDYKSNSSARSTKPARERREHGQRLQQQMDAAYLEIAQIRANSPPLPADLPAPEGEYLTVELARSHRELMAPAALGPEVRQGTVQVAENDARTITFHVSPRGREILSQLLDEYVNGERTAKGNPPRASLAEPIESIRATRLEELWREEQALLPALGDAATWWALWCARGFEASAAHLGQALGVTVANEDRWARFPEAIVVPVLATRLQIEMMIWSGRGEIGELGVARDNPTVIMDDMRDYQDDLINDLAGRISWPGADVPAVCILDTGANRAHPLIEPALFAVDMQTLDERWGVDDSHPGGHGTGMAGLALLGDLTTPMADLVEPVLSHRLETVKILPPAGWPGHDPVNYGAVTSSAVSLAEGRAPARNRIICCAVTNEDRPGDEPSRWSAALDQMASATQDGDGDDAPRRLIVQAMGNLQMGAAKDDNRDPDDFAGEDPAQAWNAITVGGYTNFDQISEAGYQDWTVVSAAGDPAPIARNSVSWPESRSPVKPDVVFEAGNRAVSPYNEPIMDKLPSLSVLTTGKGAGQALTPFNATSAATAAASRMAAQLTAAFPTYWPETIRALMAHSGEWTPRMRAQLDNVDGLRDRRHPRRRFGYGVPKLYRAMRSAEDDFAMIAQDTIQPFARSGTSGVRFGDAHYYPLPWPKAMLEVLDNRRLRLKVALSYFIEPNPSFDARIDPSRYRSHGLRFDLKRRGEGLRDFQSHTNAEFGRANVRRESDSGWMFGPDAVSAGSLHVDVWEGPAVELAARDQLCVYPVTGWWRTRPALKKLETPARYALIVSIQSDGVDLYTPVNVAAAVPVTAQAEVAIR